MLSSLNTFGGLSSAEISMLFGSNSPSSSSNATPSSTTQSAQTGVDASGANNPANAIQAILAQAEIAHRQLETSLGGSSSVVKAQTAYAEQTEASGEEDISVTTAAAQTIQMGSSGTILDASDTMSGQYTEQGGINGFSYSTSYSVTSVLNAQGEETDYFQFAVGVGNDFITVGFSVDGLGPAALLQGLTEFRWDRVTKERYSRLPRKMVARLPAKPLQLRALMRRKSNKSRMHFRKPRPPRVTRMKILGRAFP